MKKKLWNARPYLKRSIAKLLVLLIVVSSLVPAMIGTSYAALGTDFFNGLTPYGGTINEKTADGYRIAGSGDIAAMSTISKTDFVFETDVTFNNTTGAAIGIVFGSGATSPLVTPGSWVCNIERSGVAKLFSWGGKSGVNDQQVNLPEAIKNLQTYNLKMVVNNNKLEYYINDYIIFSNKTLTNYTGGYIGIMGFNADVTFTGAEVSDLRTVSDLPITGFTGGGIIDTGDGFLLPQASGDNAATSNITAKAFEFEADVELLNGQTSAALVIGKTGTTVWPGIGANIDKGGTGVAKLFKEPGGVYNFSYDLSAQQKATNKFHIKVITDADGNIQYWLDGSKILETKDTNYVGGRLGLLTFNTAAIFNNIKFTNNDVVADGFITNLSDLVGLQGSWIKAADGLCSQGTGDNFAISQTSGSDFIYSGNVKFVGSATGAGSLVFRSTNDCKSCYVANVDKTTRDVRIFKFLNGNFMGNIVAGTVPATKQEYNLRVEAIGTTLKLYVDDVLIGSAKDENDPLLSGQFGLLTFNSTINYQNLNQTPVDINNLPKLTGLVVNGAPIVFNSNSTTYNAYVDNNVSSVTVTPSTSGSNTMKINAVKADTTTILEEQEIANNATSPEIPLAVGENTINIKVKDSNGVEVVTSIKITRNFDPATSYLDTYRPQLHFTPHINFTNDPNGLVFDPSNNTWHMFFQYNPTGISIGNQVWGHTQSTDLVHWVEQPVAIPQGDGLGAIFSGSAVVDEDNSSGFFTDNIAGQSKLVAIFTHDKPNDTTYGVEKQSIAYSKDHGLTWTLYPGNPVIPNTGEIYGRDFRDPKVFRYDGKWLMVVAGGRGRIFSSDNLINWSLESEIFQKDGTSGLYSECPDLYPLKVDGTGATKWIYTASGRWYVIGDLVKNASGKYEFKPETDPITYNSDTGYATQSYYNDGTGQGRRIAVSWLQDFTGDSVSPDKVWNGMQTLPQVMELRTINGQIRLTSYPVEEIKAQRSSIPVFTLTNVDVSPETANVLAGVAGKKYDIETTINVGDATEVGFNLMTGNGKYVTVKYNDTQKKLILDRSTVGGSIQSTDMRKDSNGNIKLRIIMDVSVIEVFGNDGEAAANAIVFPDSSNAGLEFYAVGGKVGITDMKIYDMKSIYRDDISGTTPTQLFLSASKDKDLIEVGQTFTVNAAVMPMKAADKTVTWAVTDESVLHIDSQDGNTITLTALKEGTADISATTNTNGVTQTLTAKVIKVNFNTNMTGWRSASGVWKKVETGYSSQNKGSGDSFAMSDSSSKAFIYEAQISNLDGIAAGLVFGVSNASAPSSSPWYCANIDKTSGTAKMFYNSGTSEVWNVTKPLTAEQKDATSNKLKVVVSADGKMQYYLDDVLVGERTENNFTGGGMGLNTFRANATFDDVNVNIPSVANVSITGTAKVGQTLTGSYTFSDPNSDTEGTSTYKWLAGDSLAGIYTAIPEATAKKYVPTTEMVGKYLKFEVTPIDSSGWSGTAVKSAATEAVAKFVTSITVGSNASSITKKGGTLQMVAKVLPEDATDKSVTWSVINGTGSATISTVGLLTAAANGTVTIKATAKDGSNVVSNTYTVTISGQNTGSGNNGGGGGTSGGSNGGSGNAITPTTPKDETPVTTIPKDETPDTTTPPKKTFNDMDKHQWAKEAVEKLAAEGIISGTSTTTFEPGKNISRADFLTLLVKALKLKADFTDNFADVSSNTYYYNAIGIAKQLGITNGTGNNEFNPKAGISRQDMMVLVVKALKVAGIEIEGGTASDIAEFKDASKVSEYALASVEMLIKEGIIKGSGNAINPTSQLTRAESAVIIYKIFMK